MKEIFEIINKMQAAGVIEKYAIGGAVGATFYLEPAATLDVDIFVALPVALDSLVSLSPIYDFVRSHGGTVDREYLVFGGWPVQFLPAADELDLEALREATPTEVDGIRTYVMTAEHLAAIALRTGRAKDHNRILQFLEHNALDKERLWTILERHGLATKWQQFKRRYPGDIS